MNSDYGEHRHHFYHHRLGFVWRPEAFPWLPLLAGMLVTVAVVWLLIVLLGDVLSQQSQRPSRPASTRATIRQRWNAAVHAHASTAQQYAAYECTPTAVIEHPDLADVTRPTTALFIDAFTEANGLATEHYPGPHHAERFIRAAQSAQRAWQVALDTARHNRISRSTPHERVLLPPQLHTDGTSTRPGRHRAPAQGPRHSQDRPAQMRSHPQH
jgi:hypothetical protein